MFSRTAMVCALLLISENDAGSATSATKTRTADLEGSASGYAYGQQQGLPVYYMQYTNHGSGRHYHAPDTAVQYVVSAATPVAHAAPATAPLLLPYATADVSQGDKQLRLETADHVQHVDVHFEKPRAPYYVANEIRAKEVSLLHPYASVDVSQGSKQIGSEPGGHGGSVQHVNEHFEKQRVPYYIPGETSAKEVPLLHPYASVDVSQGSTQIGSEPGGHGGSVQRVNEHFEKPHAPYYIPGEISAKEVPLLHSYESVDVSRGGILLHSGTDGHGGSVQNVDAHFEKPHPPYYVPEEITAKKVPLVFPYTSVDVSRAGKQLHSGTGGHGDQGSVHHANVPIKESHAPYYVPEEIIAKKVPLSFPHASMDVSQGEKQLHETTDHGGSVQHVDVSSEEPRAPYYVPEKVTVKEVPLRTDKDDAMRNTVVEDHHDDESDDSNEDHEEEGEYSNEEVHGGDHPAKTNFEGSYGAKGESQDDGSSSFEVRGGENHESEEYRQHGKKGNSGYKKYKEFSKGEHGTLDSESQRGYHSEENRGDKGHADEEEEYGSRKEADSGEEGSDCGHSSYSKKGHKTNGFHNVYSKDEYKKVTDFYDDDHKKGHFVKYGDFDEGYKAVEGGFEKAGHRSSGNEHRDRDKKGYHDKGHRESQDQGRATEEDEKSYHANRANYDAEEDYTRDEVHDYRKDSDRR